LGFEKNNYFTEEQLLYEQLLYKNEHNYFKNNWFTEMCSGSEAGSYLRLIDFCITQL